MFKILKRQKPIQMPTPSFEDNWKQEMFEKNVCAGVAALTAGKKVNIYEDGRGYELAVEIKRRFILEYQKQLSEKIKVESTSTGVVVSFL